MSEHIQQSYNQQFPDLQIWRFRWFLVYLYAIALILSIIAAVIIVAITKKSFLGLIPAPLLLSMRPMIRWAFPRSLDVEKG